jgi:tetraacyldisaccharide 4'-kinase
VNALERLWWRPDPPLAARWLLAPLVAAEGLFRAAVAVRGALYDRGLFPAARAEVPVISVGNLAVGGAGKTPVTMALAERLLRGGRRPAILSRGYGAASSAPRVVSDGRRVLLGAAEAGDEPYLVARRLPGVPVLCGPDRAALALDALRATGADALLLDDGFQHRRLRRDLDVVVIDAGNPWGNGHCLPAGPNREPRSALARAGLVWLAHADRAEPAELDRLRAEARRATGRPPVESRHAPLDLLDASLGTAFGLAPLRGRPVALLAGVARPASFRQTLEGLGAEVAVAREYPDHHAFTEREVDEALAAAAAAGADWLVTTEKDAVRLPAGRTGDPRIRALRIEAEVLAGEEALAGALAEALGSRGAGEVERRAGPSGRGGGGRA